MEKLLSADNLTIVVLALWVSQLLYQNYELRKENKTNWGALVKLLRLTRKMYNHAIGAKDPDETGEFDGISQD